MLRERSNRVRLRIHGEWAGGINPVARVHDELDLILGLVQLSQQLQSGKSVPPLAWGRGERHL